MREYKFIKEWDESSEITTWRANRIVLNKIIRKYNKWQYKHEFNGEKAIKVLARIEYGIQTIGGESDSYMDTLVEMKEFVEKK